MASLKSLTDEELRKKLKEHGITSPVTASTRNILIKKLNHVLASQKKTSTPNSRARRTANSSRLHTFSSDEDEDEAESSVLSPSTRVTRTSRPRGSPARHHDRRNGTSGEQWRPRTRLSRAGHDGGGGEGRENGGASVLLPTTDGSTHARDRYRLYFPSVSGRSGLGARVRSPEDYDTGSDSDPADLGEDSVDVSQAGGGGGGGGTGGGPSSRLWDVAEPQPNSAAGMPRTAKLQNHNSVSSWASEALRARAAKAKSHLENGREWAEGSGGGGPSPADSVVSQAEVTSRVANGRHHHGGGCGSEGSTECPAEEESTWHYKVPLLLLVLLVVFFGVVAMLYVNVRMPLLPTLRSVPAMVMRVLANLSVPFFASGWVKPAITTPASLPSPPVATPPDTRPPPAPPKSTTRHTENRFPVCSNILKGDCLSVQAMALVQPVLGQLEEVVLPALHHHAGLYQCSDAPTRHLPLAALQDLLHNHAVATSTITWSSAESLDVLESLARLVEWNPHWGLEAVREERDEGGGALRGLALASQPTYILCHITTAIYSFLYLIMGLITVILTAWLAFSCVRYYRWKAEEEKQQVYELVEQILEVLGGVGGGGASGKDFVAVNHVRDSLIGPRDRRTKQHLWDRAVHFINHNESRVRREIQAVGGEDCEVWRWASGVPHHHHSPGPGVEGGGGGGRPPPKVWQGPAFNTLSPHNVPNVSPTSCLKIRNMFDCDVEFGDSWPARIQDSILEKCEGISIVHVAVDRTSREGCVYLKCASLADSGRAFRALHGWWYDGNLVTVKFLRDERYHQRFPSARHATLRLRPSNNKRLSLQQVPTGQPEPPSHT